MKKSKKITLVLITALLASCHKHDDKPWDKPEVYMRSDTTAEYTHTPVFAADVWLWYYAFRPYGMIYGNGGGYHHAGYYSGGLSERSNIGTSPLKSGIVRGGFGGSHSFSISS